MGDEITGEEQNHQPATNYRSWRSLVVLMLLTLAAFGCQDGCGCTSQTSQIPPTPQERLQALASKLPQNADAALFLVDLDKVRLGGDNLARSFKSTLPVDAYRQEIKRVMGIDVFNVETYEPNGIHPSGGVAVASWDRTPVVLCYISSAKTFEEKIIGSLKRQYRIVGEPVVTSESPLIKTIKDDRFSLSYAFQGDLAFLMGASLDDKDAKGPAQLADLLKLSSKSRLSAHQNFVTFKEKVGDHWPASAYVSTPKVLTFAKENIPGLKDFQREVVDAFAKQVIWTGVGGDATAEVGRGKLFMGIHEPTLEAIKGLDEPIAKGPNFKVLVEQDAMLFVRVGLNAQLFWREYQKLIPPRQLRFIKKIIKNLKSTSGIDIEKDLINNATGHAGLTILDVDPAKFQERRKAEQMKALKAMLHFQVSDRKAFMKLLDGIVDELNGAIIRQQLAGGITRYGFRPTSTTAPPVAVYLLDDLVTFASTSLSMKDVHRVLVGDGLTLKRRLKADSLSEELLKSERATGLYLSLDRVKAKLGELMSSGIAKALLGPIGFVVSKLKLEPDGLALDVEVFYNADLQGKKGTPQRGETDKTAPASPKDEPSSDAGETTTTVRDATGSQENGSAVNPSRTAPSKPMGGDNQ